MKKRDTTKPTLVPLVISTQILNEDPPSTKVENEQMHNIPYASVVGIHMYVMVANTA